MVKRPSGTEDEQGQGCEDCEDAGHSGPAEDLRRCRKDGLVRCRLCRSGQKRLESLVGTRGLDLAAHFRSKRQRQLAVEVVVSSPSPEAEDGGCFKVDPAGALHLEEETTDVPNTSPSSPSSQTVPSSSFLRLRNGRYFKKRGRKALHIGCDVCPRWFVVDHVLFDHWRESKFTCCMIGEVCNRKESHTALVGCKGVEGMVSRAGRLYKLSEPRPVPLGCWDLCRGAAGAKGVFAAPMGRVGSERRAQAEELLFDAFIQEDSQTTIRKLLSTRSPGPHKKPLELLVWLLWQESGEDMVAAAILARQHTTKTGPKELQGGMTLEYIGIRPDSEGKAYWLVLAAEEVAILMGHGELFSACDLNQRGEAFGGRAKPALDAHRRWGFEDMDQKEWKDRRLEGYAEGCDVRYMVKVIGR